MNCRYFRVMSNAYEEEGGIVISPDVNSCPHVYDGEDVERGKVFVYKLKGWQILPLPDGAMGSQLGRRKSQDPS